MHSVTEMNSIQFHVYFLVDPLKSISFHLHCIIFTLHYMNCVKRQHGALPRRWKSFFFSVFIHITSYHMKRPGNRVPVKRIGVPSIPGMRRDWHLWRRTPGQSELRPVEERVRSSSRHSPIQLSSSHYRPNRTCILHMEAVVNTNNCLIPDLVYLLYHSKHNMTWQ